MTYNVLSDGRTPSVASSQSKKRWARRPRALGSQCRSAPSAAVNGTSSFGPGNASYSCWDCPGQNASPSGSAIGSGVIPLRSMTCAACLSSREVEIEEGAG